MLNVSEYFTGLYAGVKDKVRDFEDQVVENPLSLTAIGGAAAFGGAAGAFAHALWRDRARPDAFSVSPVAYMKRVPEYVQIGSINDASFYGDGGVYCVSMQAVNQCSNGLEHLKMTFMLRPRQRIDGAPIQAKDMEGENGMTKQGSGEYPVTTNRAAFLALAKYFGQPILEFRRDPLAPNSLLLGTVYPCVVYDDDLLHIWTRRAGDDKKKQLAETPICIVYDEPSKTYRTMTKCESNAAGACRPVLAREKNLLPGDARSGTARGT